MAKVLFIDDEKGILTFFSQVLGIKGHECETAENGQEGIEKLSSGYKPNIIFLDYHMPVMNGEEFLRRVRDTGYAGIPIVSKTTHHRWVA